MRRKLFVTDFILLALAWVGAMHLYKQILQERQSEEAVLRRQVIAGPSPSVESVPSPKPVRAADCNDIVAKMVFSADRNPRVVIEAPPPAPPRPMPALPVLRGLVDLGDGLSAVMSEGADGTEREYRQGEKIGAFTLSALSNAMIVLEWDGQMITRPVEEMLHHKPWARAVTARTASANREIESWLDGLSEDHAAPGRFLEKASTGPIQATVR